jgi:hypothetical protein
MEEEYKQQLQKQPKEGKKSTTTLLARDQPVGPKPEGTSDEDFKEFEERRREE